MSEQSEVITPTAAVSGGEGGAALLSAFLPRVQGPAFEVEAEQDRSLIAPLLSGLFSTGEGDDPELSLHLVDLVRVLSERTMTLTGETRALKAELKALRAVKEEAVLLGHRLADQRDQLAELFELAIEERDEAQEDLDISRGEKRRALREMEEVLGQRNRILAETETAMWNAQAEAEALRLALQRTVCQLAELARSPWALPIRGKLRAILGA